MPLCLIEIKIKIVLLMAKFESVASCKTKITKWFGQKYTNWTWNQNQNWKISRPEVLKIDSKVNQEKVDEVKWFSSNLSPRSSVRSVVEDSSIPQTTTTTTYRIINEHLLLKPYKAQFVQQDGASAHFSRDVRQYFDKVFPNRCPIRWAPRSLFTCLRWTFFSVNMLRTILTSDQFLISTNWKLILLIKLNTFLKKKLCQMFFFLLIL